MNRLILAAALALGASGPHGAATSTATTSAISQASTSHLETLTADASDAHGTTDGAWCATTDADARTFLFSYRHQPIATCHLANGGHEICGGGQAVQISLYPLSSSTPAATPPQAALTFPSSAAIDIRACFIRADARARHDACSDQYNFTGTLSLDATPTPAKLVLTTVATTYPGHLSRTEDNTHPLTAADIKTVRDETCSYRRVFARGANGAYTPDSPLPACADYLQP